MSNYHLIMQKRTRHIKIFFLAFAIFLFIFVTFGVIGVGYLTISEAEAADCVRRHSEARRSMNA